MLEAREDTAPCRAEHQETSQQASQDASKRRQWTRLAVEEGREVVDLILPDGRQMPAFVENFSFAGAKLTTFCDEALRKGDVVEVTYSGAPMKATVTWTKEADDATWHVGLEWKKRPAQET